MVSRNHATLNVDGNKMTIVDTSSNGTYINGIRIQSGTPVPVTRKDVVSFAQVAELDWKVVPKEGGKNVLVILGVIAAVLLAGGGAWYFLNREKHEDKNKTGENEVEQMWKDLGVKVDTLKSAVPGLIADIKAAGDSLAAVQELLDNKNTAAKKDAKIAENVKKSLWQAEDKLKSVNAEELQKSLESVIQSIGDKSEATRTRVSELEKKVADGKSVIAAVNSLLNTAKGEIATLPDQKGKAKPKPEPSKDAKEEPVNRVINI